MFRCPRPVRLALLGAILHASALRSGAVRSAPIPDQELTLPALSEGRVPVVRPPREAERPRPRVRRLEEPSPAGAPAGRPAPPRAPVPDREAAERPPRPAATPPRALATPGSLEIGVRDYVDRVHQRNNRILAQHLEWMIAEESVNNSRSIFEVAFVGSTQHEENRLKNTIQEALQRSSLGQFFEFNERYNGAVEGRNTIGGTYRTFYRLDALNNNLQTVGQPGGRDTFNEFRTFLGATLTQPLLRNRGETVTLARIHVAERDRDIAFQTYRREMMRVLGEAVSAYYELVAAQLRLDFRQKSIENVEKLLATSRELIGFGLAADTDVLETEAGLARRLSEREAARQVLVATKARVRNFLSETPEAYQDTAIRATEELVAGPIDTNVDASLRSAALLAPEYLAARSKVEREGIRLAFAKNQRWPQLDLSGTWGLNGLDTSAGGSIDDMFETDNSTWNVLLEMRIPLDGNQAAGSEYRAAQYRKKVAIHEIKSTEVELVNTIHVATQNVQGALYQRQRQREIVEKNEELLRVEMERLELGMSTTRTVLQREEELNRSREDELRALMSYQDAVLALDLARGTLLERFGIERPARLMQPALSETLARR